MRLGNSTKFNIAHDLFATQIKWSLWYIPAALAIYFFTYYIVAESGDISLAWAIIETSKLCMLVFGLSIFLALLPQYVKYGVTRKEYFVGSAIAAVGVVIGTVAIALILNKIAYTFGLSTSSLPDFNAVPAWILPSALSLNLLSYYVAGWLIAAAIFKGKLGFGLIPVAVFIVFLTALLWKGQIFGFVLTAPYSLSILGNILLVSLGLVVIRLITRAIPIDVK